jgi:dTDP-L-rhamnose 4-epimerase
MKKLLITGGAGFIGKRLVGLLSSKTEFEITVLDSLDPQIHGEHPDIKTISEKVNLVIGDIRDAALVEKLVAKNDYIVHLAAQTGTGQSMYQIKEYTDVNCIGTSVLLEAISKNKEKIKKVIVSSSRAVYGEGKYRCNIHGEQYPNQRNDSDMQNKIFNPICPICKIPLEPEATDEESPIKPVSIYGLSKYYQEESIRIVCRSLNIPYVILRFQNVFGDGQSLKNPYTGILSIFSSLMLTGKEINVFEDGLESRDFIYVEDICNAIYLSIDSENANNQTFNVGMGVSTSVIDVISNLSEAYQKASKFFISGNYRVGDIRHNYANISAIKKAIGFEPKTPLKNGIKKLTDWVITQPQESVAYEESLNEMKEKQLYK